MDRHEVKHEHLIHQSYLFSVHRLDIELADGREIQRDMVRHNGAALVLPVLDSGDIVMIRNYRFAVGQELWELPCGTIETGEPPELCAARELTEETGYVAERIEKLGQYASSPGFINEIIHAYLATGLSDGVQQLEAYEQITVEILPQQKVRRMIADNIITDAKTLAALSIYFNKMAVEGI